MNAGKLLCIALLLLLLSPLSSAIDIKVEKSFSISNFLNIQGPFWEGNWQNGDFLDRRTIYVSKLDDSIIMHYDFNVNDAFPQGYNPFARGCSSPQLGADEHLQIKADMLLVGPIDPNDAATRARVLSMLGTRANALSSVQNRYGNAIASSWLKTSGEYIADNPWAEFCVMQNSVWPWEGLSLPSSAAGLGGGYMTYKRVALTQKAYIASKASALDAAQTKLIGGAVRPVTAGGGLVPLLTALGVASEIKGAYSYVDQCGTTNGAAWNPSMAGWISDTQRAQTGWEPYSRSCTEVDLDLKNPNPCDKKISVRVPTDVVTRDDYYVIVSECLKHDTTYLSKCGGTPEVYCKAYVVPLRIVSPSYCGDDQNYETPSGYWDDKCWNYGIDLSGTGRGWYCDETNHRCMDPCTHCTPETGICMSNYFNKPEDLKAFRQMVGGNSTPNSADFLCLSKVGTCNMNGDGVKDCHQLGAAYNTLKQFGSAAAWDRYSTDIPIWQKAASGIHCETEASKIKDQRIVAYNQFARETLSRIGTMGECQPGARSEADCYAAFGDASMVKAIAKDGTPVRGVGWAVNPNTGNCIVDTCFSTVNCVRATDGAPLIGVCKAYDVRDGHLCGPNDERQYCGGVCPGGTFPEIVACKDNAECSATAACKQSSEFCRCEPTTQGINICGGNQAGVGPSWDAARCSSDEECMTNFHNSLRPCEQMFCDKSKTVPSCMIKSTKWSCTKDSDCLVGSWRDSACDIASKCCVSTQFNTIPASSCNNGKCDGKEQCTVNKAIFQVDCGGPDCLPCSIPPVTCNPLDFSDGGVCFVTNFWGWILVMVGGVVIVVLSVLMIYGYQQGWFEW